MVPDRIKYMKKISSPFRKPTTGKYRKYSQEFKDFLYKFGISFQHIIVNEKKIY